MLRNQPSRDLRRQIARIYRSAQGFEPKRVYEGQTMDLQALAKELEGFNLLTGIFGFSVRPQSGKASREGVLPAAASFMPPVRDYFDPLRKSFGFHTDITSRFRNAFHCGDDVAWEQDDGTVVAVADGIVRKVSHIYNWGFIVIVEHRLPGSEGYACSLYGHLAPSITVTPGELVRKGQRLGAVGRSHTWENGGYVAHLHFGIHRGPYLESGWITGYLSPEQWSQGARGWQDPQVFIRAHH